MELALNYRFHEISNNPDRYRESKWMAPRNKHVKGIRYYSFVGSNGYAIAGKGYIMSLVKAGIYVHLKPIKFFLETDSATLSEDDSVLAVCMNNDSITYDTVIIHSVPSFWNKIVSMERMENPNVKIYGLTVWETDRVHPPWLDLIVQNSVNGLLVPSDWNRQIFQKSVQDNRVKGFPPVYVCHHAITDPPSLKNGSRHSREQLYGRAKIAFLCIGSWTARKGIDETIEAYVKAFNKQTDVVLYLKTFFNVYSDENSQKLRKQLDDVLGKYSNPPRVVLNTQLISDDHINDLIVNCDVFLSLCNSEGVGLGACQSALNGKIIVMTGYGGQREYINHGYWIDFKMGVVNVPPGFASWIQSPQQWAYPDMEHAVSTLRHVYTNFESCAALSQKNRAHMLERFNHDEVARELQQALNGTQRSRPAVRVEKVAKPVPAPVPVQERKRSNGEEHRGSRESRQADRLGGGRRRRSPSEEGSRAPPAPTRRRSPAEGRRRSPAEGRRRSPTEGRRRSPAERERERERETLRHLRLRLRCLTPRYPSCL